MNALLTDVLKQLDLKPGDCRSVIVDGYEVEIRRRRLAVHDEGPMVDICLDVPSSERLRTVVLKRGEPEFPKPIVIDESGLAPE
ncbi:MAG: hypothetical protein HYX68_13045 [Planctomycetes bacterium]|nr:hypothetical protein [Planctomycetota bacterium]